MSSEYCKQNTKSWYAARLGRYGFLWLIAFSSVASVGGCKSPWARPLDTEPSFDRLLESERKQSGRKASPGATTSINTERNRPGPVRNTSARAAENQYATHDRDEQVDEPLEAGASPIDMDRNQAIDTLTRIDPKSPRDEAAINRMMQQTRQAVANRYSISDDSITDLASSPLNPKQATHKRAISDKISSLDADEGQVDEEDSDGVVAFHMNDDVDGAIADAPPARRPREETMESVAAKGEQRPARGPSRASDVVPASHTSSSKTPAEVDSVAQAGTTERTAGTFGELSWEDHIREAVYQLQESNEVALNPNEQVRRAAIARLLSMSAGDIESAMQPIEGLQPNEQEYYRHQLKAIFDSLDPAGTPVASRRWSLAMLSQRKAHEYLAAVSNLEVVNAAFCTSVESFGVIQEFPVSNFKPDQEFLLYCEIDNFVSERVKSGGYETQLRGSYEIVDSNGQRVIQVDLPMDSHVCRNRRRDYFIAYRMHMPQNVTLGKYTLKLTIEDMKGPKFGQADLPFQIVN